MKTPEPEVAELSTLRSATTAGGPWTPGPSATELPAPVYDCWNTIGVSGNGSCRELPRYTHCRNCPVYSAAAAQLLDRPVTPEQRGEWTGHYAQPKKLSTAARISVVIFRIGPEWLALPTNAFQEVAEGRPMHTLPHRRHGVVLGLVNIRGELLICASLGRLLGLEKQSPAQSPKSTRKPFYAAKVQGTGDLRLETLDIRLSERLLVTQWEGHRLVLPVDEVQGIRRIHQDELREPPATVARSAFNSTRAVFSRPSLSESNAGASTGREQGFSEHTVGLLDADVLFATLNRNLV